MEISNGVKTENYKNYFEKLISFFPKRVGDIISLRFGLKSPKTQTLEQIGKKYGITRERVRQISKSVTEKIAGRIEEDEANEVINDILFTIRENSGIIKEEEVLKKLAGDDKIARNLVAFFATCAAKIKIFNSEKEIEKSWAQGGFDLEAWKNIVASAKGILEKNKKVLSDGELVLKVKEKADKLSDKEILDYLGVSLEIRKNVFGKWGMSKWPQISPRGMREKAYLVLGEQKRPLHFRKIAELIDESKISTKKAHPQTVHNELIKDSRFVLVGRGIYALKEWGYEKGTVKEVIDEILKKSAGPVPKNKIINEVLKSREVRKTTILVNLNNAKFFKRLSSGYILAK